MRHLILGLFVAVLVAFAVMFMPTPVTIAEDKPSRVLRHIVLYKFKDGLSPEKIQEVIDAFAGLPKKIDGIVDFEHGPNTSTEGKSDGLTYAFVVSFKDEAALKAYLVHPAHVAYVNIVKDRREKVVVFDYWTN